MDWRSVGLAPTLPRPTMLALLGILFLLATVPSAEAAPVSLSSLPSASSTTGILLAVLSVVVALSLVIALVLGLKKYVKKWVNMLKLKKKVEKEETETARQAKEPEPYSDPSNPVKPIVGFKPKFYEFLKVWTEQSNEARKDFIAEMVKEFPVAVTPSMVMDVLQTMLKEEVNADVWFRMLRFTMMVERHLFHWDQTDQERIPEREKMIPSQTHERFQAFLVGEAEEILRQVGDFAEQGEDGDKGFMRFIAFLFGFVCRNRRILKVMDETFAQFGFNQKDASRAVVWGYRRWKDNPRGRFPGLPTTTTSNGNHETFRLLMSEFLTTDTKGHFKEGSKVQHLLFALGFGYEPDWEDGPLANMNSEGYYGNDYLWLMMGRDLAMGNAWQWMCKEGLSEHDRMCKRFGQDGCLYEDVIDMVMKYPQEYAAEDGHGRFQSYSARYSAEIAETINFAEHDTWYDRFQRSKKYIGAGIKAWLMQNDKDWEKYKHEESSHDSE